MRPIGTLTPVDTRSPAWPPHCTVKRGLCNPSENPGESLLPNSVQRPLLAAATLEQGTRPGGHGKTTPTPTGGSAPGEGRLWGRRARIETPGPRLHPHPHLGQGQRRTQGLRDGRRPWGSPRGTGAHCAAIARRLRCMQGFKPILRLRGKGASHPGLNRAPAPSGRQRQLSVPKQSKGITQAGQIPEPRRLPGIACQPWDQASRSAARSGSRHRGHGLMGLLGSQGAAWGRKLFHRLPGGQHLGRHAGLPLPGLQSPLGGHRAPRPSSTVTFLCAVQFQARAAPPGGLAPTPSPHTPPFP